MSLQHDGPNIRSDVDLARVFRSPHLKGLHGFRPIAQTQDYTCGAAAVAAVIRYLGGSSNEGQAASAMGTNCAVGTTPEQMVLYLKGRNLKTSGAYNVPFSVLTGRVLDQKPTLVAWNDYAGHWVVVAGIEPLMRVIILADPARPRSLFAAHSYEQFQDNWRCDVFGAGKQFKQLGIFVERYQLNNSRSEGLRPRGGKIPGKYRFQPYKPHGRWAGANYQEPEYR